MKYLQHAFVNDSFITDLTEHPYKYHRQTENYEIFAADYKDNKISFTLCLNRISLKGDGKHEIYVSHYRADSVYINYCETWFQTEPEQKFIIGIGPNRYSAVIDSSLKSVRIWEEVNSQVKPTVQSYNDHLPSGIFKQLNGSFSAYSFFEHQDKLLYVILLPPAADTLADKELAVLNTLSDTYKDQFTSFILIGDSTFWASNHRTIKSNWVLMPFYQAPLDDFQFNYTPSGALFDSDGKIINRGLLPSDLEAYLKKTTK